MVTMVDQVLVTDTSLLEDNKVFHLKVLLATLLTEVLDSDSKVAQETTPLVGKALIKNMQIQVILEEVYNGIIKVETTEDMAHLQPGMILVKQISMEDTEHLKEDNFLQHGTILNKEDTIKEVAMVILEDKADKVSIKDFTQEGMEAILDTQDSLRDEEVEEDFGEIKIRMPNNSHLALVPQQPKPWITNNLCQPLVSFYLVFKSTTYLIKLTGKPFNLTKYLI